MVIDVPPAVRSVIRDPKVPLFITEGVRKADAGASIGICCVALLGVFNFRGKNDVNGVTVLADWEYIALRDRTVYVVFDSDVMLKRPVHHALARLKAFLESKNAIVYVIYLPPGSQGEKVGLDDYLATGHNVQDLLSHATAELREPEGQDEDRSPYREADGGLHWMRHTREGVVPTKLTNFTAKIVGEVIEDDGVEESRLFEIQAELNGRTSVCQVPAQRFGSMNWPLEVLGAGAIVEPGLGLRDHARAAIQALSGDPPRYNVYRNIGWRRLDGGLWVYAHAGGAIGPNGPIPVRVALEPALANFDLPIPPAADDQARIVKASLEIISVAPDVITLPLLAALYRSVLCPADFSVHVVGHTGVGKTELVTLPQQHFGPNMDARHLPGSWSGTANALEELAFLAKDALLVCDDFAPGGTLNDIQRIHRDADRLLRGQGNAAGRRRMRADGSLRPPRPPRGLLLSTGEDVPRGQSLRARMWIIEVAAGDVQWSVLTRLQRLAADGVYASAMAAYICWIARNYTAVQRRFAAEVLAARASTTFPSAHRRAPDIAAHLVVALHLWAEFAVEVQAISAAEADELVERTSIALAANAAPQNGYQDTDDPCVRFLELVASAMTSGKAHLTGPDGSVPETPHLWGWRQDDRGSPIPTPNRIGWVTPDGIFLDPDASFAVVQKAATEMGEPIPLGPKTLGKRLRDRKLTTTEAGRDRNTVRKTLEGARREVLHLLPGSLLDPRSALSFQSDHATDERHARGVVL
jgi:hypothetical protein